MRATRAVLLAVAAVAVFAACAAAQSCNNPAQCFSSSDCVNENGCSWCVRNQCQGQPPPPPPTSPEKFGTINRCKTRRCFDCVAEAVPMDVCVTNHTTNTSSRNFCGNSGNSFNTATYKYSQDCSGLRDTVSFYVGINGCGQLNNNTNWYSCYPPPPPPTKPSTVTIGVCEAGCKNCKETTTDLGCASIAQPQGSVGRTCNTGVYTVGQYRGSTRCAGLAVSTKEYPTNTCFRSHWGNYTLIGCNVY
jgi:hypothetical protein